MIIDKIRDASAPRPSGPSNSELKLLGAMLDKSAHPNVAEHLLKGFLWAVWPEWYESRVREIEVRRLLE